MLAAMSARKLLRHFSLTQLRQQQFIAYCILAGLLRGRANGGRYSFAGPYNRLAPGRGSLMHDMGRGSFSNLPRLRRLNRRSGDGMTLGDGMALADGVVLNRRRGHHNARWRHGNGRWRLRSQNT